MKFTSNKNRLKANAAEPMNKEVIDTTQVFEKESMKKLNCQSCGCAQQTGINYPGVSNQESGCPNQHGMGKPVARSVRTVVETFSAFEEGSNNPPVVIGEVIAAMAKMTGAMANTRIAGIFHRVFTGRLQVQWPVKFFQNSYQWIARPHRLRQVMVWLLAFIIFAQPNMAVAQVLTAQTPYERARQAAIAASLPASKPSWFTKLAWQIPDLTPVVSTVVDTAKAAFFLVFPFEESKEQNFKANQGATLNTESSASQALAVRAGGSAFGTNQSLTDLLASPVSFVTPAPYFQSGAQLTDSAISLLVPTLNNGRIEGNLRVFEGRSFNINSGFQLTQDLFLVGTPTITVNSGASYGGIIDDGGAATPSNYTIILNSGANLPGKFHIHANAIPLPTDIPTSVPQPAGTRDLNINNAGDVNNIGDWATVRDLSINVANLTINVPPGNYRQITLNAASRLTFANGTYNFSNTINLNTGSSIQATGTVVINIGQSMNINGASIVVAENSSIGNVKLNVLGTTLNLNSNTNITGFVRALNAPMNIQGNSRVRGQVIAKEVRLSGGEILGDSTAPTVSITTPANGFSTTQATISVSGTAADAVSGASGIARVTVNNTPAVYNSTTGTWSIANVPLNIGANTITAKAEDLFGNIFSTQITVTRLEIQQDTTAPQLVITTPANNTTTQADSITVSGTVADPAPNASGVASVTVNNVAATRDIAAGTWTSTVGLQMGANSITVRATDIAGNISTQSITVTREQAPPPDTTPPVVTISLPANNAVTGDVSISVSGTAVDPGSNASGVLKVSVNGVDATFDAGNNTWTATGIGLQNGNNRIVAQAEDHAHNIGSAEINVRKANPPTLTITNPQTGTVTSSSSLTVAGTVSTDSPDVSVTVTVNGQTASIAGGQFTKAISLVNGTNTVTVVATDSLNQTSQSSITVIHDQTAPTVELIGVPTSVQAGNNYTITANASDETGLDSVEFAVDGQPFVSDIVAPYQFTLAVPANAAANQVIVISAIVRNSAGLTATATARTRVSGPGGVSGYVFDDATGYGIAGVSASFSDGLSANTDSDGSFIYISNVSVGLARMSKAGYTVVERAYTFSDGGGSSLFDARLTSLGSNANAIGAQGGTATGDNGRVSVVFGAGAFADGSDVRITSVSPQGLINLLPFGWSPVPGAVIDIRRSDPTLPLPNTFPSTARLTLNETSGLASGTGLTLVRYNENTHNWIVVNANITAGANGALQADIVTAGQYAFLVADTGITAPPVGVAGQALPSSPAVDSALLETATAFATSSPRSSIISAEARSTIAFIARATAKLPSGVAVEASFGETYNLLSQTNPLLVERPSQDFVLYSYPAATTEEPNRLGAFFIAKPTRFELSITQLRSANVHVVIRSGRPLTTGTLIGTTGGQVTTADGATSLDIAAGALPAPTPIFIEALRPADVDLSLPSGYEIVGAVNLDLSSTVLSTGGTISVPTVSGDLSRIVVARVISAGGRRAPKIVARATEVSGKLRSTTAAPSVPNGVTLSGVNVGGLYLFIRVPGAFGYLSGVVSASGQAAAMVRVTANQTPFADVTGADGRYVMVGAVGSNNLEAASLVTDATGTATATLSGQNGIADTAIAIASVPLAVQSVTPANSAANIIVTTPITVSFSKPVSPSSVTGSTLKVSTSAGNPVLGSITLLAGNRLAVFTPQSNLLGSTSYKVTVTTGVKDIYGGVLSAAFESTFSTAAVVSADNRLKPEKVSINYPNGEGFVTVTIPAGAVPTGSTIVLINNASGATVTTVAGSAEISLQIQAQVGDEITVLVRQPDGTEYRINQAAYKKADGTTTVGRNGGAVSSVDGETVLTVPKNAISGQVDLKLTPKVEADIAIPRVNEMDAANMPFGGGVEISAQGNFTVEKELHLELPAPASAVEGQRAAFLKPTKVMENGQEVDVWEVVTSGRVEGGKIKTNSPPFFGLLFLDGLFSVYSFMPVRQKVALGTVKEPTSETDSTLRPVPNVLCVLGDNVFSGMANRLTARTNNEGYYSIFDVRTQSTATSFVHAIDDANGRRGVGSPASYSSIESGFLQGLQGFSTYRADITLAVRSGSGGQAPPQITLSARSTSGAIEQDPLVQQGTVPVPSTITVRARTDKVIGDIKGSVMIGGAINSSLTWTLERTEGQAQTWITTFDANAEGSYSVLITGFTVAGDSATSSRVSYNFIALRNPNTRPPLEGAPAVLTTTPANGAIDVDVTTDVRIEFSEPVVNLIAGQSVYIQEDGQTEKIGGTILSGGVVVQPDAINISSIIFKPSRALIAAKRYCVYVTTAVKDSTNVALDQDKGTSGDQQFSGCFTTFSGLVLNDTPVADPGFRVVVTGSYAVTLLEERVGVSTLTMYDISSPQAPVKKGSVDVPQRATAIDVSEAITYNAAGKFFTRIAAITTHNLLRPEQNVNLWIVNLDDVDRPEIAGVTSLYTPQELPTTPLTVRLQGDRAFVGSSPYRGVIAVDVAKSVELFAAYSDPLQPQYAAVTPAKGFGQDAKVQSVRYFREVTQPSLASSVAVLEQNVTGSSSQGNNPQGGMNVAYAIHGATKQLVSIGFSQSYDGVSDFVDADGQGIDDRVLNFKSVVPQDATPSRVRTVAGVQIGAQRKDLAVVLGSSRLWIFDVNDAVNPLQYPSKSFAEMGLTGDIDSASYFDIEGTLAYIVFHDRIAVVDFSDPANPLVVGVISGVGTNLTGIAVKDGFIYTLSPGTGLHDGLNVSIARPASAVFIHGLSPNSEFTCANPVILDRQTRVMKQRAEIFFQVFGHAVPTTQQVIIRKNETVVATVQATTVQLGTAKVAAGRAEWITNEAIDGAANYTAEIVLDEGTNKEYHSLREPVPFSFLISDHQAAIGLQGSSGTGNRKGFYSYVLGGNSQVTFTINSADIFAASQRPLGLNVEPFQTALADGRYSFRLRAVLAADATVTDEVTGFIQITNNPDDVRPVGHTVISGVDLGNGNLGLSYTDVEIPNRGLSLSLTRSYNSLSANVFSPFGSGWHHNYQVLLVHNAEGQFYTLVGGDGQGQIFRESTLNAATGEMKADLPFHTTLVKGSNGTFDYFSKSHIRYHFPGALEKDQYSYYKQSYTGNLEYIEEPNKNRLSLSYDAEGRMIRVSDSSSRSLNFEYEQADSPFVGVMSPLSATRTAQSCVRKGDMGVIRNRFVKADLGKAWRIKKISAPGGLQITYNYDIDGNLIEARRKGTDEISTAAADYVWAYEYKPTVAEGTTPSGELTHLIKKVTEPNGNATNYSYVYDKPGMPATRIDFPQAISNSFAYTFAGSGNISKVVVKDGKANETTYNMAGGYTDSIASPRGADTDVDFVNGMLVRSKDAENLETTVTYDAKGNPKLVAEGNSTAGGSRSTAMEWDQKYSKPLSVTDANNHKTNYTLDDNGNVNQVTLPTGRTMSTDYAPNGDILKLTDERGLVTEFKTYDAYGNPTKIERETEPGKRIVTTMTYDVRSRLKTTSDSLSPSMTMTYDALDRVLSQTATDPTSIQEAVTTSYSYKPQGQLASMTMSGGSGATAQSYGVSYVYDGLNRSTGITETANGTAGFTRNFTYDGNSNLLTETDRRGVTTAYSYDELNYMRRVDVSGGGEVTRTVMQATLDKVGNVMSMTDLNGQATSYGYDGLHRATSSSINVGGTVLTQSVTLDANGNPRSVRDRNGRETTVSYDVMDRVEQVTDAVGRVRNYVYDDRVGMVTMSAPQQGLTVTEMSDGVGRPLSKKVKLSPTVEYTSNYAYNGRDVTMTNARGVITAMKMSAFGQVGEQESYRPDAPNTKLTTSQRYSAFGGMTSYRDENGRTSQYSMDGLNRVTQALYPTTPNIVERFSYDEEGNLLSHVDGRGITRQMSYDNLGRVKDNFTIGAGGNIPGVTVTHIEQAGTDVVTDPDGGQLSLPFASKDIETDPLGHQTTKRYDGLGRLLSITNADSRTKRYEYDGVNLTRESDWKGQFTSYRYDRINRLTEMIDRVGQLTAISYNDANGLTKTITDRRTNQRVEVYDALGRMSSVRVGGQLLASYEYDAGSNRTAMIDGRNNRTQYSYDAFNRVTSVNHAGIQTETFGYDDSGNLTSYFDGRGGSVGQSFDELNRMVSRTDGAGNTTQFKYDGRGLLTELIEPKRDGQNNPVSRTLYEYNELGSLTKVIDANQGVWQYGYDAEQKLISITDAEGRTPTTFEYDVLHRMTKTTRPLGMVTTASFDANGNRKTSVDPMGRKTTTTYDALDRAKSIAITHSDDTIPQGRSGYALDYDPEGNLLSVVEQIRSGATTNTRNYSRTYDSRNRLTSTTDPYNRRVSYGYDATNNVTSMSDAANRQTSYSYDAMNRLDIATLPGGRQVNHDWTADGLLSKVEYGNGMSRVYGYDNADRVTSIVNTHSASESEEFVYGYDANSNRESEIRKRNGATTRSIAYQFDALNRLTQASYGGGASVSYGYDKVGNRLSELGTEVGGALVNRTYAYNELNQMSSVTDALTPGQSSTLSYDLNGNLLKEAKPNGEEKRYEYDALNQMSRAASFANNTETTLGSYDYDFQGRRISKTVGTATTQYVYSGINVVNEFDGNNQLTASYDFGADLLRSDFAGEGERLYFHDALGSTTSLATSTGATVAKYEYDAWGKLISSVQPSANKVNYTGYRKDDETGLDYAQARYYDSSKGRFTSFDPVTENSGRMNQPQGMNYYGYVMGNPLKYTDPKGKMSQGGGQPPQNENEIAQQRFDNFRRNVTPGEIVGAPATENAKAGHAYSKHGVNTTVQASVVNAPERIFTGINENGRAVDIYYKNGSVIITEAGKKHSVITGYGRISTKGPIKVVDPAKYITNPRYVEIKVNSGPNQVIYPNKTRWENRDWPEDLSSGGSKEGSGSRGPKGGTGGSEPEIGGNGKSSTTNGTKGLATIESAESSMNSKLIEKSGVPISAELPKPLIPKPVTTFFSFFGIVLSIVSFAIDEEQRKADSENYGYYIDQTGQYIITYPDRAAPILHSMEIKWIDIEFAPLQTRKLIITKDKILDPVTENYLWRDPVTGAVKLVKAEPKMSD